MPHAPSTDDPAPERREVKITVYASIGVHDPPPDSLVEIPEPTDRSLAGRAPEHRGHVLAERARLTPPLTITGTDGADKIVVSDPLGETRWLFLTDVRRAAPPPP